MNNKIKDNKGITLIALIITVIVLLILAGTAVSIAINGGDLFSKAATAREEWNVAATGEETEINDALDILNDMTTPSITMTLGTGTGVVTKITPKNYGEHLGKIVTNYTPTVTSATNSEGTFNVSNKYRLYYIDWNNKYGDGEGTIYLKADISTASTNSYRIRNSSNVVYNGNVATSKLEQLNPSLYKPGVTSPTSTNINMNAVRWLTDTTKWSTLIAGLSPEIASKVNYVIGSPSIEMMVDSYNTHYGLLNETMDLSTRNSSTTNRTKVEYLYPVPAALATNNSGYAVGPSTFTNLAVNGYYFASNSYIIMTDSEINDMYFPSNGNIYWLASPMGSSSSTEGVAIVGSSGYIQGENASTHSWGHCFCPVVSLKPDVNL